MASTLRPGAWRSILAPGLVSLVCLAILLGLGIWQLERKGEKEALIARILARAKVEPPGTLPVPQNWDPVRDEFRRVRVIGSFQHEKETLVHGLAAGEVPGRALQGYYLLTPFQIQDGGTVLINRGFVPTELKATANRLAGQVAGLTTVTGILRGSEPRTMFVPAPDPVRNEWFNRDIAGISASRGIAAPLPYLVEADGTPNPGGWPKGGQLRVDLPNNHLQYAFTWFGIAACLLGVFGVFAWRRLHEDPAAAPS
ncbi:surfeit 1 [Methylobacterium sp. Leaf104]|uniref:SURF1 family protein n=1 Tax=Methylobacterium TaxID=407 RepID=UPI0006FFC88D|nr:MULTISPECIES: SURF1 family protein [Methylobacterium]KQP31090.1 surfeit 1 [Methylobacterium sp. Leaf104]MCI9881174.1 SURF1 family protein [Methylobacterium goesingense]